jgi:hypothetical protein
MDNELAELDDMQKPYKDAVDLWVNAIREEQALASVNHKIAEVGRWEAAHFREDALREEVRAIKEEYEKELRRKFFGF